MQSFANTRNSSLSALSPQIFPLGERNGKGYNQSALDPGSCEKARIEIMRAADLRDLPFAEAAEHWLKQKELTNRDTTVACYRDYVKRLERAFTMPLKDIHIGHLVEYQRQMRGSYHPASVNHDLNTLSQILRQADLWRPLEDHYKPLRLPQWQPPKVMTEKQEDAFFELASSNKSWWTAYWVASLTNNTTASGKELRMLKLEDVNLEADPPRISIPRNMKTDHRTRVIPLNDRGAIIMERVLKDAGAKGSTRPEHYIFPFRKKRGLWEPTQPASESWLKYQWKKLVDAAIEKEIIGFRVKPHNLRHQAITKIYESGAPEAVVMAIAGHVRPETTRHYSHTRLEALAGALKKIAPKPSQSENGNGRKNREEA